MSIMPTTFVCRIASKLAAIHLKQGTALAECSIVHQDIEVAELFEELAIRPSDVRFLADVGVDWMRANRPRQRRAASSRCVR